MMEVRDLNLTIADVLRLDTFTSRRIEYARRQPYSTSLNAKAHEHRDHL